MKKIKLFRLFIFDESNIRASQSFSYNNWQNGSHYTAIKDDGFYTSDTEAFIVVEHMENDFQFDTASIVMVNARDGSKVSRTMAVDKENNTVSIELETNQLAHFGTWRAQVLYMYRGETFTSPVLIFEIEQTLGDEQPAKLEDIQSVSGLMNEVNQMLESLRTYGGTIDLTKYALKSDLLSKSDKNHNHRGVYQPVGNYLTSIPDEYVTENELAGKGYATRAYVDSKGLSGDQQIDLTNYATVSQLNLKADKSDVLTNVPANAKFTDTVTTINGKTGAITKADIEALGISGGGNFVILSQTEYDALGNKNADTVYLIQGSATTPTNPNPVITTQDVTRTETIPFTTSRIADSSMNIGTETVTTVGSNGVRTIVETVTYTDGVETNRVTKSNNITTPMVPRVVRYGTKETEPTTLTSVLKQANIKPGGSTNTYVNGERTANDAIPIDKSFELRQWAAPSGAFNIFDGDLKPNTDYTIAFTMENVGTKIDRAWFVIGTAFFGGKHFFNGTERTITPSAGEYDFTSHLPATGAVNYVYHFTTSEHAPAGDYFQSGFDNSADNTKLKISNLGVYQGKVASNTIFGGA